MSGLRRKVATGAAWTTGLHGLSLIIELVLTALLARLLFPADFGVVAAAMLFMGLVNVFSEVGVAPTIVQLPNLSNEDLRAGLTISAILSVICAVTTYLFAPLIADLFHMDALTEILRALGLVFLLRGITVVSEAKLTRDLHVKEVRLIQLASRFFGYGLVSAFFAFQGYGPWSLVFGTLVEEVLRAGGIYAIARVPLRPTFVRTHLRRVMASSAGFTGVKIVNFIALNGDTFIVARATDAISTGLYSRAFKLMSFPTTLYTKVADQILFPALATIQDDKARLKKVYLEATAVSALVGLPISAMIALVGPDLILFFYGPRWTQAIPIFTALSVGIFARFSTRTSTSLLRATGSIRASFICQVIYAVATVVGCALSIHHGLVPMAYVVSGALLLSFFAFSYFACEALSVSSSSFFSAHIPALRLCFLVGLLNFLILHVLHERTLHGIVPLLAVSVVSSLVGLVLLIFTPVWFLGTAGVRVCELLRLRLIAMRPGRKAA